MYYRHNLDYKYPDRCDEHMITVKKLYDLNFDEDYPYRQKGFIYGCIRAFYWFMVNVIVFPLLRLTHGLRIDGKENLKKYKKELKGGAITVSNHVFMWDFLCVLKAVRPRLMHFPGWKTNLDGPNRFLIRMSGGIPIPTNSLRSMVKFKRAMESVLEDGKWLHVFPEGSMWFFYPDIRPLKNTAFTYAVKYGKPIVPIAMSFRERRGITKLFTKKPCVDLHIGEVMFPDKTISPREAINKMHRDAYHVMQVMCGINPGDPTYNTDQNLDNYKKTM